MAEGNGQEVIFPGDSTSYISEFAALAETDRTPYMLFVFIMEKARDTVFSALSAIPSEAGHAQKLAAIESALQPFTFRCIFGVIIPYISGLLDTTEYDIFGYLGEDDVSNLFECDIMLTAEEHWYAFFRRVTHRFMDQLMFIRRHPEELTDEFMLQTQRIALNDPYVLEYLGVMEIAGNEHHATCKAILDQLDRILNVDGGVIELVE